ncbi:MAG: endonuclease [Bacteroidales bacterium]|jgi:endonuclease I|nr:endonuclease [Bacteroidales bacterium]
MNILSAKKFVEWVIVPIVFLFAVSVGAFAQPPQGYYNNANGKSGYTLKTALHSIIKSHTSLSYSTLWDAFEDTDLQPGTNKIWDMYSNCNFTYGSKQCGNYSSECDCYNREHSFPKSWFDDASPMYTDLFHLVPTDGKVNGMRSNYPFGNVGNPTYTSGNGSKLGACSGCGGYTKTVFEPIDEYKGDFARNYFYMVTCYEDKVANWSSDMLNKTKNQAFTDWAKNLLIEWHRQDPVSEKEINRNNAVYQWQKNRNPFIDYPGLAEKIWGGDNTPFYSDTSSAGVEVSAISDDNVTLYEMYPAAEIISISGVRLKQVSSMEVESALSGLPRGIYIVRYISRDGKSFLSKKVGL